VIKLLLDEHISPQVARGLRRLFPRLLVFPLAEFENSRLLGCDDATCLQVAAAHQFTFVSYDRRTIPPLLKAWAEEGVSHGGIIFVDEKTIAPSDIGSLVRCLAELVRAKQKDNWTDCVCFLSRPQTISR
jgi:hypothetical protein